MAVKPHDGVEFGGGELKAVVPPPLAPSHITRTRWLHLCILASYLQSRRKSRVVAVHMPFVNCICDLSTVLSVQNCLVRCDNGTFAVVVGDFGLAEKIPDYRSVK